MKTVLIKTLVVLVGMGLHAALSPCGAIASQDQAKDKVLAIVGTNKLTLKHFQSQIDSLPVQLQVALAHSPEMKEQFLDRWVKITLLAEAARGQGLEKDPEVRAQINDLANSVLAQEFVQRALEGKVDVSDQEVKTYYENHKQEFTEPAQVKARHILVKAPADGTEKDWNEAKKKAENIRKELLSGADFAALAKKYSDDPGTKDSGGELGFFKKGRMVPEFEQAAFSLKKGEISQPVKTVFGYHIIQVEDTKPAKERSFQQVQDQIRHDMTLERQSKLLDKIIAQLKAKYPVKVNKELLKELDTKKK